MDERKRGIAELRKRVEEYSLSLDSARESLGLLVLSATQDVSCLADEFAEYKRLERDISEAQEKIQIIEEDLGRQREIRAATRDCRRSLDALNKDSNGLYEALGEAMLESNHELEAFAPFRARLEAIAARIDETENHIARLETTKERDGVFSRLGKSARAAMMRSSQTTRRSEARRALLEAGLAVAGSDAIRALPEEAIREADQAIASHRAAIDGTMKELADLEASDRIIAERLSTNSVYGSSGRTVQRYEKLIEETESRRSCLCREVGDRLLSAMTRGESGSLADFALQVAQSSEGAPFAARARAIMESRDAAERQIEKLEASIRIDELSNELTSVRRSVSDHEERIAASQRALEGLSSRATDLESEIETLTKLRESRTPED